MLQRWVRRFTLLDLLPRSFRALDASKMSSTDSARDPAKKKAEKEAKKQAKLEKFAKKKEAKLFAPKESKVRKQKSTFATIVSLDSVKGE